MLFVCPMGASEAEEPAAGDTQAVRLNPSKILCNYIFADTAGAWPVKNGRALCYHARSLVFESPATANA